MTRERRLTKIDWLIMGILVLVYSLFSFHNLGSMENPNTFVKGKERIFFLDGEQKVEKMRYFTGHEMGTFSVYTSVDGTDYTLLETVQNKYVFAWYDVKIDKEIKYVKLVLEDQTNLGEMGLYDQKGSLLSLHASRSEDAALIDEQKTIPKEISYLNSTYFDEVYFARTAYEYANDLPAYEWVHPPLGKLIMAAPIKLFKMAPFYYRFMGNIAGILMIPVLYIFAKRMFKKTKYATLAALFLCFDGFHFVQTRMGTVDSFLALFMLTSFLFMYEYLTYEKEVSLSKKLVKLFLSGLFMGLSISVKWTGCFGALALAILFFIHFFKNHWKKKRVTKEGKNILLCCTVFFVGVPVFIYTMCYLLFPNMYYFQTGSLPDIGNIMRNMFTYHSSLKDDHAFYSAWYTWPVMLKPVWYYVSYAGGLKSTISGIGNPIVWWIGSLGMIYVFYQMVKKEKKAFFLGIIYICFLVSYFGITRGMFLYHYFPVLPFTMLAGTYLVKSVTEKLKKNYIYLVVVILIIFFFFYFLPVLTGEFVDPAEIDKLKWFSTWIF